jgi:hypothetical protein
MREEKKDLKKKYKVILGPYDDKKNCKVNN